MNIKDITPEDIEEIIEASKNKDIAKPVVMSKLSDTLLYSGVFMVDNEPGMVKVKESELRMVLEELKKVKNLQVAQQKLVTEQNRVYLQAELEKTQKALQESLEDVAKLRKQNEGLQRRVDELEYRFVEAKMTDMKRIDEAMEEDVIEKTVNSNSKKPQPKAALMLLQESREENVEKDMFMSIVEADKEKRLNNDNDGFGNEELKTKDRVAVEVKDSVDTMKEELNRIDKEIASLVSDIVTPQKDSLKTNAATLAKQEKAQVRKAQVLALSIKGAKNSEIMKTLSLSKNTVYKLLSVNRKELEELYSTFPQIFEGVSIQNLEEYISKKL